MQLKSLSEIINYVGPVSPLSVHHSLFSSLIDIDDFREEIKHKNRSFLYIKLNDLMDNFSKTFTNEQISCLTGREIKERFLFILEDSILEAPNFDENESYHIKYKCNDDLASRHNKGFEFHLTSENEAFRFESNNEVFTRIEKAINEYYQPYHEAWSTYQLIEKNLGNIKQENKSLILENYIHGLEDENIKMFIRGKINNDE